jgi:hypothetical protein
MAGSRIGVAAIAEALKSVADDAFERGDFVEAPLATRSRVVGIVTVCSGTGPLGVLAIGVLSEQLGPSVAILIMAGLGVSGLSLVWTKLIETRPDR